MRNIGKNCGVGAWGETAGEVVGEGSERAVSGKNVVGSLRCAPLSIS